PLGDWISVFSSPPWYQGDQLIGMDASNQVRHTHTYIYTHTHNTHTHNTLTYTHTQTHTCTHTPQTHTHTYTHTHTHSIVHTANSVTYTHTHTQHSTCCQYMRVVQVYCFSCVCCIDACCTCVV